jgi:hypothetical protein
MKQASQPDPSSGTAPASPDKFDRTLHKLENLAVAWPAQCFHCPCQPQEVGGKAGGGLHRGRLLPSRGSWGTEFIVAQV